MSAATPIPTIPQMEQMGLIRCEGDPACPRFIDPANVPSRKCGTHQRKARAERRQQRDEMRCAPHPDRHRRGRGRQR